MGSMQIRAGIWCISVVRKGEVRRSRGGMAIIMTHVKVVSMCAMSVAPGARQMNQGAQKGVEEFLERRHSEQHSSEQMSGTVKKIWEGKVEGGNKTMT